MAKPTLNKKLCKEVEAIIPLTNYKSLADFFNYAGRIQLQKEKELIKNESN